MNDQADDRIYGGRERRRRRRQGDVVAGGGDRHPRRDIGSNILIGGTGKDTANGGSGRDALVGNDTSGPGAAATSPAATPRTLPVALTNLWASSPTLGASVDSVPAGTTRWIPLGWSRSRRSSAS